MLSKEKQMEVLEAYDLTKSYRAAAQLVGVDHHTVARAVALRAAGLEPGQELARPRCSDGFIDKIEEWVERSSGKVRADVVHERLVAMGYSGSERTTRRVVAAVKRQRARTGHRIYRPWIPEPGLWLQYDFGKGPLVGPVETVLFCAWLAWSRFRVFIPLLDRSMPSVIAALDQAFRLLGGAPTYLLTDNEKTVTDRHIAGVAVRNEVMVSVANYYGVTVCTCVPADPESKGGSEAAVRVAKADLVPTAANLLDEYSDFDELGAACRAQMDVVNHRVHAVTRRVPAEALEIERPRLHPVPDTPYRAAFGESRLVGWSCTVSFRGARYSVPHEHCDTRVWVRRQGDQVVIVAGEGSSAAEIARHPFTAPGHASILDEHYPERSRGRGVDRRPRARRPEEARFLALGEGAARYLVEAATAGAHRIETRMAEAVSLAALHGTTVVDEALCVAAFAGRFLEGDLESIIVHRQASNPRSAPVTPPAEHSLAQGTAAWSNLGARREGWR